MSLGPAVNVVIGLVFCYLLLGLVGSSLQEAIAAWMNWRGRHLRRGLQDLLAHDTSGGSAALFDRLFDHGLVKPNTAARDPSYISARNFGIALIDCLRDGSVQTTFSQVEASIARLPPGQLRQTLTAMLVRAGGDLDAFQASVEHWFDDAMDRVSGYYKRFSHNFMLVFGVAIAVGGNIDSLAVAHTLWTHPEIAVQIAAQAEREASSSATAEQVATGAHAPLQQLAALPVPIGWQGAPSVNALTIIGWIVTALAVSLGAPFWFDTLQRILNLRTAGPKPDRSNLGG